MKILMVGGTWDMSNGSSSHLIKKLYDSLMSNLDLSDTVEYYNGGNFLGLTGIIETVKSYDVVFWMANVPNDLPKIRNVKKINPHTLLIGSKRNIGSEYSFVDVLNKTLEQRNNLSIMFSKKKKDDPIYTMTLFDPLGTLWYEGTETSELMKALVTRVRFLLTTTRRHTTQREGSYEVPDNKEFFAYVREVAEIFHKTIQHSDGVTRLLGNASFRIPNTNMICVTARDVDKSKIDREHFVVAFKEDMETYYYGDTKPSKDTTVQALLYQILPNINYIVHSHCYVADGMWTQTPVPCGAMEEVIEVLDAMKKQKLGYGATCYRINLIGHGCLILGETIDQLKQSRFITRNLPENIAERKV